MQRLLLIVLAVLVGIGGTMTVAVAADTPAKPRKYELTRNNVQKPDQVDSSRVSLYGVRLGDSEIDAVEMLVNEKIPGSAPSRKASSCCCGINRTPPAPWPVCRFSTVASR